MNFQIPCCDGVLIHPVQSLAYAEMSTVLAKLLWHFDIELLPETLNWDQAKSYVVWEKDALKVKLTSFSNNP